MLTFESYIYIIYWSDGLGGGRGGHLTIIVETGIRHLPTKNSRITRHLTIFQMPRICPGECSWLELSRTLLTEKQLFKIIKAVKATPDWLARSECSGHK